MGKRKKLEQETGLESGASEMPQMLQPIDIQQAVFRRSFRGYSERDVDEFLDRLTEGYSALHEENRRLRLQGGGFGSGDASEASQHADEILRRARDEAEAILRDARGRAGAPPPAAPRPSTLGVSAFLSEEKEFLQSLASLIQQHAEAVKTTARDIKQARQAPAAPAAPPAAPDENRPATRSAWEATSDRVVNVPAASTPAGASEPASASTSGQEDQRSLRELFWGED